MAIRANQLTNFKGEPYATSNQVEAKITELSSSVEAKIQKVDDKVQEIKTEVTDGLLDKDTGNLNAKYNPIKVLSTDNKTGLDPIALEEGGEASYYPDNDYSKIQFIGDCKVTYRNDGQIVIRIGENLNSSNFNTNPVDGQTTGVAGSLTQPSGDSAIAPDGSSVTALTEGNYTVDTSTTTAKIHFENNESTYFLMDVSDNGVVKTYYFGPITGSGTYNAKLTNAEGAAVSGVTLTVSNFGEETKTSEGATGYCGSIKFTIAASAIAGGDASKISITSVTHKNGGEGDFGYTCGSNSRYFYVDTNTKASVTGIPTYEISNTATATKSGITYFTKGSVTFNASGLENMLNPAGISGGVAFDANNWATDTSVSATVGSTTASKTSSLITCAVATPTVKVTPKNINGTADTNGSQTSANDFGSGIVVYTGSINANIDEGNGTVGRITSTGDAWTSANALGATDLQLYQGKIVYPNINFTGFNGANADRDYSALGTGDKVYYVKLPFARVTSQPTLTITGTGLTNANLKAVCIAPTLDVIDNRNALLMTSAGGICDNSDNKNATSRVLALSFMGFGESLNTAGAYAKIVMSGTGATISNITLA